MKKFSFALLSVAAICFAGCGDKGGSASSGEGGEALRGSIQADGSSTVHPFTAAFAEEFRVKNGRVSITVGESGTGGGFKRFCRGETDISNASRPMRQEEIDLCKENGVEFIELPVAYDALTVVVNPKNTLLDSITVEDLKRIWEPNSTVKTWRDLNPAWPDRQILLFGPGQASGTFDYFTEAIVGKAKSSRTDYSASESDNELVNGVAGSEWALGYFGFSYYEQNKSKLKALKINGVEPSFATVENGTYQPLSRPLLLYINKKAAERPEVKAFIHFILDPANREIMKEEGFVPLPNEIYDLVRAKFDQLKTGTVFGGKEAVGLKLDDLLKMETGE
jgi:phosphate transport system substrate-binding protein